MADKSKIEWTDATWNPIRGCSRVSEGCRNCYAERVAARFSGPGMAYEGLAKVVTIGEGTPKERREAHWTGKVVGVIDQLTAPMGWKKPRRIFVNSMSDLFHESVPVDWIDRIFGVMLFCQRHTFQILTKRPERMQQYCADPGTRKRIVGWASELASTVPGVKLTVQHIDDGHDGIVLGNVWLGVSVENQEAADERIPLLVKTPAAVRWLSIEPLLGPISLRWMAAFHENAPYTAQKPRSTSDTTDHLDGLRRLDWVVVGGESGPGARPMHPEWARTLRDQCADAQVPFFFKQWGQWSPDRPEYFVKKSAKRYSHETFAWNRDGEVYNPVNPAPDSFPSVMMYSVGKKAAGRRLDLREHNEYPRPRA